MHSVTMFPNSSINYFLLHLLYWNFSDQDVTSYLPYAVDSLKSLLSLCDSADFSLLTTTTFNPKCSVLSPLFFSAGVQVYDVPSLVCALMLLTDPHKCSWGNLMDSRRFCGDPINAHESCCLFLKHQLNIL